MSLVVNCQVSTYINIKTEPSCSTLQETPLQTKTYRSTAAMCNQQLLDPSYDQSCNQLSSLSLSLWLSCTPCCTYLNWSPLQTVKHFTEHLEGEGRRWDVCSNKQHISLNMTALCASGSTAIQNNRLHQAQDNHVVWGCSSQYLGMRGYAMSSHFMYNIALSAMLLLNSY